MLFLERYTKTWKPPKWINDNTNAWQRPIYRLRTISPNFTSHNHSILYLAFQASPSSTAPHSTASLCALDLAFPYPLIYSSLQHFHFSNIFGLSDFLVKNALSDALTHSPSIQINHTDKFNFSVFRSLRLISRSLRLFSLSQNFLSNKNKLKEIFVSRTWTTNSCPPII